MAQLAIKGHATRGEEVIQLLEMLGGKIRCDRLAGNEIFSWYYINGNGFIDYMHYSLFYDYDTMVFTLEEFLEKFPYKVGDKVQHKGATSCGSVFKVEKMRWVDNHIEYTIKRLWYNNCHTTVKAEHLQPYKEETMEEITDKTNKIIFEANAQCCDIRNDIIKKDMKQVKIDIPKGYEFFGIDDDNKIVLTEKQPQYPKTYEECARLLNTYCGSIGCYNWKLLSYFQKLLICRDAYWKIAGEQMGLGKPWKPDWYDVCDKYTIYTVYSKEIWRDKGQTINTLLAFPTMEMRDAFYENFKELIEECKELL